MIEQLYPVQPNTQPVASPRRLPTFWLWTTRVLWVTIFLIMLVLNGAAIVTNFERTASGNTGGAAGLKAAIASLGHGHYAWRLTVDPTGPAAQVGMQTGNLLLAANGEEIHLDDSYRQVNDKLRGRIGDPLILIIQDNRGIMRQITLTLVAEDLLQIWRRFRVPLAIAGGYLPSLEALLLVGYLMTSALIFWRRTDDWLALYLTITLVLITPQLSYAWYFLGQTAPYWDALFPLIILLGVALTLPNFYILPNGRFVPPWTLILTILWVIFCASTELFPTSPFSIYRWSGSGQLFIWLGWFATGMLAQVYRFRSDATPTERQQIKWTAFGLTVAVIVNLGWTLAFELFPILSHPGPPHWWMWMIGRTIYVLGMMMLPISFGIAVFRYRLWDIDNLINRTLVYGALTAIIVGIYVVVVSILSVFLSADGQFLSQIIAIALDLIIFAPLRDRLQKAVDRLMFGETEDLPAVVSRLGKRLNAAPSHQDVLPVIVATLAESLKLPYVAISMPEGDAFQIASATGEATPAYYTWPLVYHRIVVGHLILAPRALDEPFKAHEWQLIESLSYHISAAVHDIQLEHELASYKQKQA